MDDLSSDLASLKIDRSPQSRGSSALPRVLGSLVALALLAGAGVWIYPRIEAQFFKTEVKTSIIADVSPSQAVTSLTATGYVIAERRSKVGANISGRIAKVSVREGAHVAEGDLLVELDAADQQSNVAGAQARVLAADAKVLSARASLRELQVQLERQKTLLTQNAAARSSVDDLEARIATAQAAIEAAIAESRASAAQVQIAKVTLGRMTVRAPIDGTVLDKPREVGETVDPQASLLELADLASLVVEVDVPESRLSLVKLGAPCEISLDAFAGKRFRGKVRELGKRVNRSKATLSVKVEFTDDNTGVLPDMSARVSFLTEALDQATLAAQSKLVVPTAAVVARSGQQGVFVVSDAVARFEPVTLGPKSGDDGFELVQGPASGTRVVMNPDPTLSNGQRVKERQD
ncbi:MAG: family efflux transporter subunit [Myxococcaceae bacterium]|nr:family efflux transporter subunit [Myxococcaceae bacterium]